MVVSPLCVCGLVCVFVGVVGGGGWGLAGFRHAGGGVVFVGVWGCVVGGGVAWVGVVV